MLRRQLRSVGEAADFRENRASNISDRFVGAGKAHRRRAFADRPSGRRRKARLLAACGQTVEILFKAFAEFSQASEHQRVASNGRQWISHPGCCQKQHGPRSLQGKHLAAAKKKLPRPPGFCNNSGTTRTGYGGSGVLRDACNETAWARVRSRVPGPRGLTLPPPTADSGRNGNC